MGCESLTKPSQIKIDTTLIYSGCVELTPMVDDSFGATTLKLAEVAGQYHKCRKAAFGVVEQYEEQKEKLNEGK